MNKSNDSIEERDMEYHTIREDLDPKDWFSRAFLTFYGRVVDRGNQKPYQPEMLFNLSNEIQLSHCHTVHSEDLKDMLKKNPISLLTCAYLTRDFIIKELKLLFFNDLVHLLLPFILIEFVKWIQMENPGSSEGKWRWQKKGYFLTLLAFILSMTKIFCQTGIIEYEAKSQALIRNTLHVKNS